MLHLLVVISCLLGEGVAVSQPASHDEPGCTVNVSLRPEDAQVAMLQVATPQKNAELLKKNARIAFAWYLGEGENYQDYACAVLVAAHQVMSKTNLSNIETVLLHTDPVPQKERFENFNIRLIQVKPTAVSGKANWVSSFLKLRVAELFEYSRIVYFDVDTFPLGSMDSLFKLSDFPVEIAAPRAYWLEQPFVQSGGPMVIDPRPFFYRQDFEGALDKPEAMQFHGDSEMDWVNEHFRDSLTVLDGFYALLIAEWCPQDNVYQHFQKHFNESSDWVYNNAKLVHFIAGWKPWNFASTDELISQKCPNPQPELRKAVETWWQVKLQVC